MMYAELLGKFRVLDDRRREIEITVHKARALLAYLVSTAGRKHSRDYLATLFWANAGDYKARQSLRRCLTDLRRALGPNASTALVFDGDFICADPRAVTTDVASVIKADCPNDTMIRDFLCSSAPLEGMEVVCEPFDEWLAGERHRLQELKLDFALKTTVSLLRDGRQQEACKLLDWVSDIDPGNETAAKLRPKSRNQSALQIITYHYGHQQTGGRVPPVGRAIDRPLVQVRNNTPSSRTEVDRDFGTGLLEEFLSQLSRHNWLAVSTQDINADYSIAITARSEPPVFRATTRLICDKTGITIWSESLSENHSRIIDAEQILAGTLASRMASAIERQELQRARLVTHHTTARSAFAAGKAYLIHQSPENFEAAKKHFELAISLDPEFAPAYAMLAVAGQALSFFRIGDAPSIRLNEALRAANSAIKLDPSDALSHLALGRVLTRTNDFEAAISALDTAVELCPTSDVVQFGYGVALYYSGRQTEALPWFYKAAYSSPANPRDWRVFHMMARSAYDMGDYDSALKLATKAAGRPNAIGYAHALRAASAKRVGLSRLAREIVGSMRATSPRLTTDYMVRTFGNENTRDGVSDVVDQLRSVGLRD